MPTGVFNDRTPDLTALLVLLAFMVVGCEGLKAGGVPSSFCDRVHQKESSLTSFLKDGVETVFRAIKQVADWDFQRSPGHLKIVEDESWTVSVEPDGCIYLSESLVTWAYSKNSDEGDSLIAFHLGHELAHLARDGFAGPASPWEEFDSDRKALLYVILAGFEPDILVEPNGNFLDEWKKFAPDERSLLEDRKQRLFTQLARIRNQRQYFHFGLRFYQMGRFERAARFLEAARNVFPGPSVLNALGLSYFQRALQTAPCELAQLMRFKLPTLVDRTTLAEASEPKRGGPQVPCLESDDFREARRIFRLIRDKWPDYLPALLNYSSLLIMEGSSEALNLTRELVEKAPSPQSQNLKFLAFYLTAPSLNSDGAKDTLAMFEELSTLYPSSADVAYNHASLVEQLEGQEAAAPLWRAFLKLEPRGEYADWAHRKLGTLVERPVRSFAGSRPRPPDSLSVGVVPTSTAIRLQEFDPVPIELRDEFRVAQGERVEILYRIGERDFEVAVIEKRVPEAVSESRLLERYGTPLKQVRTTRGKAILYNGFGYDLIAGRAVRMFFFKEDRP